MKKTFINRLSALVAAVLMLIPSMDAEAAARLQDVGDKLVIVIDPGHGGDNRGTLENNHEEKFMTMTTALAMYEELQKYDNVEVYLTRAEDVKMSLEERAEFAVSVDADFMFSIHYNASANHELYGSEVWVSLFPPYNGYGLQFGYEFLTEARDMGLLVRGVKTRPGDNGDYYGIIRYSLEQNLPAVIIEHCHVDNKRDTDYCDSDADLKAFGIADATAVAKYFGLSSRELGVDYSGHSLLDASATSLNLLTRNDSTEPDFCQIELAPGDRKSGKLTIDVTAADYDSPLMYYSYSLDGGITFSERKDWPGCDTLTGNYTDTFQLELDVSPNVIPQIILRAYNPYDLYTDSNLLVGPNIVREPEDDVSSSFSQESQSISSLPDENNTSLSDEKDASLPEGNDVSAESKEIPGTTTFRPAVSENVEEEQEVSFLSFLKLCLAFVIFLFIIVFVSQYISYQRNKKRRRQRRNDPGDSRNQLK